MNFLCPACRTPLPKTGGDGVVPCTRCGVQVDLTRLDTAPGTARLWPDLDLAGESLGEYKLTRRLAAGGMGVVYEAEGPQGPCAVKVLSALLAAEPELRTRFRREAAALRAIEHPGVVRIFAEGEERGFSWYAMERVQGSDLRARLESGPLPPAEVEALARRLLETLAVVHGKGFVHRDIKPGNILLSAAGPKLCDFGIARFDGSSTLTESAAVLGSLRYMAPEQRLGRTDARSDLYAVGIVLHEALAKGVPGEAALPRNVPGKLRRLVGRLLAERPVDRPADAMAALVELDRTPKKPIALGLGAVAAICTAAWFALGGVPPAQPVTTARAKDDKAEPKQVKEPRAAVGKESDLPSPAPQAQAANENLGNQGAAQQADLPREALPNVGLATDQKHASQARLPNADDPVDARKPETTKEGTLQPIRGMGTKGESTKPAPRKPPPKGDRSGVPPEHEEKLAKKRMVIEEASKKQTATPAPRKPEFGDAAAPTGPKPATQSDEAPASAPATKGKKVPATKGKVASESLKD